MLPQALATDDSIKTNLAQRAQHSGYMTIRTGPYYIKSLFQALNNGPAFEQKAKVFYQLRRPLGHITNSTFLDLSLLAVGFSQEDARG